MMWAISVFDLALFDSQVRVSRSHSFSRSLSLSFSRTLSLSLSQTLSLSLSLSLSFSLSHTHNHTHTLSLSLSLSLSRSSTLRSSTPRCQPLTPTPRPQTYWSYWSFNEQRTSATPVGCPSTQRLGGHRSGADPKPQTPNLKP